MLKLIPAYCISTYHCILLCTVLCVCHQIKVLCAWHQMRLVQYMYGGNHTSTLTRARTHKHITGTMPCSHTCWTPLTSCAIQSAVSLILSVIFPHIADTCIQDIQRHKIRNKTPQADHLDRLIINNPII